MDKLKTIYKHPYFLPAVYLLLISILVIFAGPYFAFAGYVPLQSIVVRLLIVTALIAGYVLYRYITYLKKQGQQDSLVDAISQSDDVEEAIDAESHALKSKYVSAFDLLKQTKGGPTSLIELPWYMIIGSPGSGKTTLLSNSGLNFPLAEKLNSKHLDGIGGTKNCDWWITNEAVLLDTAGRYTSQDSFQEVDKSGWQNFLQLIKRYRKKPISGIMVSVSMADMLSMNEYELRQHISQLKLRISEVNQFFNTRFPVYVLVTKSDMLAGFTEFFDSYSHKEREQAFGFTFNENDKTQSEVSIENQFRQQFTSLIASVTRRQWPRMSMERDARKKSQIYSFSDQVASLQQTLCDVIATLSNAENSLNEELVPGKIRGLYFTSGTQNGAPIDRMLSRISSAFGLRHSHHAPWNNDQRSYFIKDLLQLVVFKEADTFGTLVAYQLKKARLKKAALALFSVASILICSSLYASFNNNQDYLALSDSVVERWLSQYQGVQQGNANLAQNEIAKFIPALNEFANDVNGLSAVQNEHFSGLGLDQERSVNSSLSAAYERLLSSVLLPYVETQMVKQMRDASEPVRQYQALKSYIMLNNTEQRNNDYIVRYLLNNMNVDKAFSEQQYSQVQVHLSALIASDVIIEQANEAVITQARQDLNAQPLDEIYYQQFRDIFISDKSNYTSLAQLAGSQWRSVFSTTLDEVFTISNFFSPGAFTQFIDTDIQQYIESLNSETWVLGDDKVIDPEALQAQFEKLYAQEYVQQWQGIFNAVDIKKGAGLASMLSTLPILTESSSPIFTLLDSVAKATNFTTLNVDALANSPVAKQYGSGVSQAQEKLKGLANADGPEFFVTSRFTKLHELMSSEKRASTQQRLSSLLQEISIELNLQSKTSQTVATSQTSQALKSLQGFGYLQIEPLSQWIEALSASVMIAKNQIRKEQLSALWQNQILNQCRTITTSKYPFAKQSTLDASLQDIALMFGKTGIIANFFDTHLAELVNTQTRPWSWKSNVNAQYQFAPSVLPFFEQSHKIQTALFSKNPALASQDIIFTPVFLDPRLSQIKFSIFGKNFNYQFGRPSPVSTTWPPSNPERNSEIIFVRRDNSELALRDNGLFSFFKLIETSEINRKSFNEVEVTFSKGEHTAIYKLTSNNLSDPLLLSNLSQFSCIAGL